MLFKMPSEALKMTAFNDWKIVKMLKIEKKEKEKEK